MKFALVRLAILQIMHGTLADVINTPASIKVAAAKNSYNAKDFFDVGVEPRIRGGQLAKEGQFPWQAGILCTMKEYKEEPGTIRNNAVKYFTYTGNEYVRFSGATLISDRHLLTAAHLIWKFDRTAGITINTTEIEVKLGTLNVNDGGIKFKTNKYIVHPEYDNYHILWPLRNDIAIIELTTSVSFTKFIYPVQLPPLSPLSPLIESENKTAIASGYGQSYDEYTQKITWTTWTKKTYFLEIFSPATSGILRYVRMRILPNKQCPNLSENQMCTEPYRFIKFGRPAVSVGICGGDEGGPLVISTPKQDEYGDWMDLYTLIGVASYSTYSNCGGPSYFTRVSSYMSFIRQNTNL